MARWFEEVRLGRHCISDIGAAFYVREMLNNECLVNKWDLRDVFGPDANAILERLQRAGMLKVTVIGSQLKMKIVAPGDRKRKRCRELGRTNRALVKFEKQIVGERKSAERSSTVKTGRKSK